MKFSQIMVAALFALISGSAFAERGSLAVTVTVQPSKLRAISENDIGKLVDLLKQIAIIVPAKKNIDAYTQVQHEIHERASIISIQPSKN